jgi:hypothetical protein
LKMIFKIANETDAIPSKIQIQTIHCQLWAINTFHKVVSKQMLLQYESIA